MAPLKLDVFKPHKMFIARKMIQKSWWYQMSIVYYIKFLTSYLIPHIVLLISRLPHIVQKCFCTPDGAMDPPSSMFIAGEIKELPSVKVFF